MKKEIKRAFRGWRDEFLSFWKRFNAFQRIVIGIILSMILVYMARMQFLNPLKIELEELTEELSRRNVPLTVPEPDRDDELQQSFLRADSLRQSIEETAAALAAAEESTSYRLDTRPADAQSALMVLANRAGLRIQESRSGDITDSGTIQTVSLSYDLRGNFAGIYDFLRDLSAAPYLWEVEQAEIVLLPDNHGINLTSTGQAPGLNLRLTLSLLLYGERS